MRSERRSIRATPRCEQMRGLMVSLVVLALSGGEVVAQGSRFAVRFYGTGTGQMDRIRIPLASSPLCNVASNFTMAFWMRADAGDNAGVVASGQNGDGWITGNVIIDRDVYGPGDYGDYGVAMGRSAGRQVLAFGLHNGDWGETIVGTNPVADGLWHPVAITRQASDGLMRIFVDGTLDAEGTGPTGNVSYRVGRSTAWPNSDPYLVVGAEKHDAGREYPSFNGSVDELRLWSRVLSGDELTSVAARIVPPAESPGMVAWFRLEEGTNQAVRDSASGYTGTLFSGVSGNGEWTRWAQGQAAPIQAYQPTLSTRVEPPESVVIRWYGPQNISFDLEETDSLLHPVSWSAVSGATNLTAADTDLAVTNGTGATERRFFRARGVPYR